jgi:hypothetical protein
VHRLIVAFLKAGRGARASGNRSIWGRAAPGVRAADWDPPFEALELKDAQ